MTPNDPYVFQRCIEIESAVSEAEQWAIGNEKLGAYLAGYLTVVICGVIEDCVEHLIGNRAGKAQTANYSPSFAGRFMSDSGILTVT